ncbi:PHP domain-containing protein [Streptomyces sp. NPDC056543]|uniref:PHP domain-containing protein n=1 Tax=unclassified Streptomyces TaxID=2593676 RepID=UPI0036ACCE69
MHLHVASGYSARYGASHPRDLVARAAERGIGTLALTGRDTVTGIVRFAKAATNAGIRPVFGTSPSPPTPPLPHTRARRSQDPGAWWRARSRGASAGHAARPVSGGLGATVPSGSRCGAYAHTQVRANSCRSSCTPVEPFRSGAWRTATGSPGRRR